MNLRLTSSALALAAMTAPAFADVTPEQVWQSWLDYYQSIGYTVTEGKRDTAGETLTNRAYADFLGSWVDADGALSKDTIESLACSELPTGTLGFHQHNTGFVCDSIVHLVDLIEMAGAALIAMHRCHIVAFAGEHLRDRMFR